MKNHTIRNKTVTEIVTFLCW